MIIKTLIADNVLKYSHLELTNLPESGLIGISGNNESGKSSIGEMICFGLFGRSFTLTGNNLTKLIKWGRNTCSITLVFYGKDDRCYRVVRHLDLDQIHGARLFLDGEEEPLVTGGDKVTKMISDLIGFRYAEYVESFYLAQRELRTPSPTSNTIKVMAGIVPLSDVKEELQLVLQDNRQSVADTQQAITRTEDTIKALQYDPERQPRLEAVNRKCDEQRSTIKTLIMDCENGLSDYRLSFTSLKTSGRLRLVAVALGLLAFLFGADLLIIGQLASYSGRGSGIVFLLQRVNALITGGNVTLGIAISFGIMALSGGIVFLLSRKKKRLRASVKGLITLLEQLGQEKKTALVTVLAQADEINPPPGEDAPSPPPASLQEGVEKEVAALLIDPQRLNEATSNQLLELKTLCDRAKDSMARLDQACEEEQRLDEQVQAHQKTIAERNEQLGEQQHQVNLHREAISLLDKGIDHVARRFNQDVLNYTVRAIPLFTNGHYKHLKIDNQMNVRVFSSDKHDFMDFEELSSGTQRQIMLALRLAMSQKLMHTAVTSRQFVFLDEPFAFFDRERIHSTLAALPGISKDIPQIWIVAQELDAEATIDLEIKCDAEKDELTIGSA